MTTPEHLNDIIAALHAQLSSDEEALRELGEALDALPPGARLPIAKDDLLEPLQMRPNPTPSAPALWLGLRG